MALAMYVAIVLTVTAIGAYQANQYRMVTNRIDHNAGVTAALLCRLASRPGTPNNEQVKVICQEFGVPTDGTP
jgi:hypothetical protein